MNNALCMRRLETLTDSNKQLKPFSDTHRVGATIFIDRHAINQFHRHVWRPVLACAAIHQPCNTGMFQVGQNLSLVLKSQQCRVVEPGILKQLDGDFLIEGTVDTSGSVHSTHAAAADGFHQLIWTNAITLTIRLLREGWVDPQFQVTLSVILHQPQIDQLHGFCVTTTLFHQPVTPLLGRQIEALFKPGQRLSQIHPDRVAHAAEFSWVSRKARAARQCRFTVGTERDMTSAVSGTVRPPK